MVTDVQSWLDNPTINFGWLVRGDESGSRDGQTVRHSGKRQPPGANYPIHGVNSESDSDSFADCNVYANS